MDSANPPVGTGQYASGPALSAAGQSANDPMGAYGLQLTGIAQAAEFLSPVAPNAPRLQFVRTERLSTALPLDTLTATEAHLNLAGDQGTVFLQREPLMATFAFLQPFPDEAILHPFGSGSVAIANRWLGRDTFHAGAFLTGNGAWALIGDKGQGKSSTLGYLALNGVSVLTDDLLVTEGPDVLAGPAFIDLRPDAAAQFGTGRDMGVLGARSRFRLDVATPPSRVPLLGWIILVWDDEVALDEVPVARRLELLFANRAVWREPPDPRSFLAHAALPMWQLRRPKDWEALPQVLQLLTDMHA